MAARVGARNGQYDCMRNAANQSNRANASNGAGRLPSYVDITVQYSGTFVGPRDDGLLPFPTGNIH